jgi:hypothetical protein
VLRSFAAVLLGYLVFGLSAAVLFPLTGRDRHAAAIASHRPPAHAVAVGALIALGAVAALIAAPADSRWSQLGALFLMAPAAALGRILRRRPS